MDIYRYFAENESKRFIFLFTYRPSKEEFLYRVKDAVGYEPFVYDIFPEPNQKTEVLNDILSVMTADGRELFIPPGLKVNYFDQVRVLFGNADSSVTL